MVKQFTTMDFRIGTLVEVILLLTLISAVGFYYVQVPDTEPIASEDEPDHVIDMEADDWYFDPDEIIVEEGDRVRLVIDSYHSETGTYDHGIHIPSLGVDADLPAGETTEVEFVADEPGEHQFYCDVYCGEGHHDMTGTLIVEERDDHDHHDHDVTDEPAEMQTDIDEISLHASNLPGHPDYTLYANGSYEDPVDREPGESMDVEIHTTFKEVNAEVVPGTSMEYWTFDGTVPGPMFRVREGDTINWTLHNEADSDHPHNIAIHAATGPGGGGMYSDVGPNGTAKIDTTMLDPGVYIYHCAFPEIPAHIAYGMYGVIVVEPEEGLEEVDHEFYVVQGELYTTEGGDQAAGDLEDEGHLQFSRSDMYEEQPSFVTFNGRPDALREDRALGNYSEEIHVNDTVRVFFGNGGPSLLSSYRPFVGEKIDHYGGDFTLIEENEETVTVPAGAAKMFEANFKVPGVYNMYDHSAARTSKGAYGETVVQGDIDDYSHIFNPREYDEHLR